MQTHSEIRKPIVGISCGDLNGIGLEVTIKALSDSRIMDICIPILFANNKSVNYYRKNLADINFPYSTIKDYEKLSTKQPSVFQCWEEDVSIIPGQLNETGGKYALISLKSATAALKAGQIDALVTAPIHKKNIQGEGFPHKGHTPFFKEFFGAKDVLMLMVSSNIRVGLVTEHTPILEVAQQITREAIQSKLKILDDSLQKDFGIEKPKIAVLGLNPHAGDEGLIGKEEINIIHPAIKDAKHTMLAFGPYSADAFFARGHYTSFDAVLAMYHDQGLIPFKSLAFGEGTNFTAGLDVVRTSPDHGTAFDIAGKNKANGQSMLAAIFEAVDIYKRKKGYVIARRNPLRKISARILANVQDE